MADVKKWPKFTGEKAEKVRALFLAGESMNLDYFATFFADDVLYQFSNSVLHGIEAMKGPSIDFLKYVEGVHHHIKNIWDIGDEKAVVEMDVTYIRHDGKIFTLPVCDIVRFKGDKVQELLIFMDVSPVYTTPMG